ncbi:Putative flippase GtrA (transmembrane translocase of bactoprenol-linked glucose) [Raineyella antarctica]|uniref:Putative flippase GtrA (Transmembrane translocase of bactoprenol-linked glucose) n=1 Tax=Raineyella antarctica TaxID=1577474 RepID=A0A1G6HBH8_9ACTN|nr:GtrA family protein [Raineyella antarctica]SDB91448.1 Putative flippase GtrA (transmembrane translocase of bactoprenol-linked glucose) [Raineyella antarctica]
MTSVSQVLHRYRNALREFASFGVIGGSGVLVNMVVFAGANNVAIHVFNSHEYDSFVGIPGTDFAIRNYIVYNVVAFLFANVYNFVLNRHLTFRHGQRAPFLKEYGPFLLVGAVAQVMGIVILQLLMNRTSPLYLHNSFFVDGEPFWRRRVYWAQFIQILVVMPINFVVNKVWTFRVVRQRHAAGKES